MFSSFYVATTIVGASGLISALLLFTSAMPIFSLFVGDQSHRFDTVDAPVVALLFEAVGYVLVFSVGFVPMCQRVCTKPADDRGAPLPMAILVAVAWVIHLATALYRTLNMYGVGEGFCLDTTSRKACPVARYNRTIESDALLGGDCVFWYWGDMQTRETMVAGNADLADINLRMLELMDWSRPASYGVYGAQNLKVYQDDIQAAKPALLGSDAFTQNTLPDISHCWYWGCHPVCNEERHFINVTMLVASWIWFVVEVVLFSLLVHVYCRRAVSKKVEELSDVVLEARPAVEENPPAPAVKIPRLPVPPTNAIRGRRLRF